MWHRNRLKVFLRALFKQAARLEVRGICVAAPSGEGRSVGLQDRDQRVTPAGEPRTDLLSVLFQAGKKRIPAFGTTGDWLILVTIRAGASAGAIWTHIKETRAGGFPDNNLLLPLFFWSHLRRGFEPLVGRDRALSDVTKFLSRLAVTYNGEFCLPQG